MARDNIFDRVLDETSARVEKVTDRIGTNFRNVKPFDKVEIPKEQITQAYRGLTPEQMQSLVQKHGEELVNQFIFEQETQ